MTLALVMGVVGSAVDGGRGRASAAADPASTAPTCELPVGDQNLGDADGALVILLDGSTSSAEQPDRAAELGRLLDTATDGRRPDGVDRQLRRIRRRGALLAVPRRRAVRARRQQRPHARPQPTGSARAPPASSSSRPWRRATSTSDPTSALRAGVRRLADDAPARGRRRPVHATLVIHTDGIPTTGCAALPGQGGRCRQPGLVDTLRGSVRRCRPAAGRRPASTSSWRGRPARPGPDRRRRDVPARAHHVALRGHRRGIVPGRSQPARPTSDPPRQPPGRRYMLQYTTRHMGTPGDGGVAAGSPGDSVVVDTTTMGALVPANDPPAVFTAAEDAELAEGHSAQRTIERAVQPGAEQDACAELAQAGPRPRAAQGRPAARAGHARPRINDSTRRPRPANRAMRDHGRHLARWAPRRDRGASWPSSTSSPTGRRWRSPSTPRTSGRRSSTRTCCRCCRSAWCSPRCSRPSA